MQCFEVEKWMEQYADDELAFLFKKDVEIHISDCRSCEKILINIQQVRSLLKHSLPEMSPSPQMDARVFEAFNRRHLKNTTKPKVSRRNKIFGSFAVPKPAFALAAVLFAVALGLAFQAGKITATDVNLTVDFRELSAPKSETVFPAELIEEPEIKTEETPVIRERVVTRVVYVDSRKNKVVKVKTHRAKTDSDNFTLNNTVAEDGYMTHANLKGFKPTTEIKPTVIKGDQIDAK